MEVQDSLTIRMWVGSLLRVTRAVDDVSILFVDSSKEEGSDALELGWVSHRGRRMEMLRRILSGLMQQFATTRLSPNRLPRRPPIGIREISKVTGCSNGVDESIPRFDSDYQRNCFIVCTRQAKCAH